MNAFAPRAAFAVLAAALPLALSAASVAQAGAVNITVFHINEGSFGAAPLNENTGDLLGDMYFDLRSKALALECSGPPSSSTARDCDNQEVNPPVSDPLVITKLVLTVMPNATGDLWSGYGRCNVCVNGTDNHGNNSCTEGAYWCSCGGYGPRLESSQEASAGSQCAPAVGRENLTVHYAGRACGQGDANYECWKDASARKLGGTWYSTTSAGYGTAWKVAQVVKRISKACADNVMNNVVEKEGKSCFTKCGPTGMGPSRNTSSACWIECFESTVLGPDAGTPGGALAGMPVAQLVKAWNEPFDTDACPPLPVPPPPAFAPAKY